MRQNDAKSIFQQDSLDKSKSSFQHKLEKKRYFSGAHCILFADLTKNALWFTQTRVKFKLTKGEFLCANFVQNALFGKSQFITQTKRKCCFQKRVVVFAQISQKRNFFVERGLKFSKGQLKIKLSGRQFLGAGCILCSEF